MTTIERADDLLVETVDKLLEEHATPERIGAAEGGLDRPLWDLLEASGLTLVGVPESRGGSGGTLHDFAAIAKAAGRHGAPVPLADSLTAANTVGSLTTLDVPTGPLAYAAVSPDAKRVRVPWAGTADHVVLLTFGAPASPAAGSRPQGVGRPGEHRSEAAERSPSVTASINVVAQSDLVITASGQNYPGEPWLEIDTTAIATGTPVDAPLTYTDALAAGALARALLMAGACQRVAELSVQYVMEREQFGKPIGKFQILQHYLAEMAGEAAAAEAAADNAIDVIASGADRGECTDAIAAAKAYAGRSVGIINRLAHQIHGAIGYTDEHRLQYWTRRLWAWRDEYGTETEWAAHFGRSLAAAGGAALWPRITNWPPPMG